MDMDATARNFNGKQSGGKKQSEGKK